MQENCAKTSELSFLVLLLGVTPGPLLARLKCSLSRVVLLHVTRQTFLSLLRHTVRHVRGPEEWALGMRRYPLKFEKFYGPKDTKIRAHGAKTQARENNKIPANMRKI